MTRPSSPEDGPEDGVDRRAAPASEEDLANILVVDDHPANLLALEGILEPLGQRIVKANSGAEALKRLLVEEFAVILMDVQMPGLDGTQTARLIKEREKTRHIPIIFLTAISRDSANIFRGYSAGAVDYLLKPFDPDILRTKVQVFVDLWLRGRRLEQREAQLRQREREVHEKLREARFRHVTDVMPLAVLAGRADGTIYWANHEWKAYTGLTLSETTAGAWLEVVHPDDRAMLEAARAASIERGGRFQLEYRIRRHDGEYRWFLVRAVPDHDEYGRLNGWIGTHTDVDERVRAEAALRRANDMKDAFIAAASHELRTPIAAAKATAQLALRRLRGEPESPANKSLRTISGQIDRMAKLVEDLLDVSRVQVGRLALDLGEFDVSALVRETAERLQLLTETHVMQLELPESLTMTGDRGRLEQVVTNLVSNAIRYSPKGGSIDIRAWDEGEFVRLSVSDHGVGIPLELQATIFERFGRAHGSKYGGLGLGLTIAQGIVAQHTGEIWVESSGVPGEGSTFHVRLPRVAQALG